MALNSAAVSTTDDATAAQFNALRNDVIQHTHEGTDTAYLTADAIKTVTGSRTLSLPTGATDTIVTLTATQTLTNKRHDGIFYLNDSANAQMTTGLTINQGGADDEILALKSSDVAHGVTGVSETDTFALIRKLDATGGLRLTSLGAPLGTNAMELEAYAGVTNTAKTTAAIAPLQIVCGVESGASVASLSANGNLVTISDVSTARFIFDVEGSAHADVEWTTYDSLDDLGMVADIEQELLAHDDAAKTSRRHALESAGIIGKNSWHTEDGKPRAMVNMSKLAMLHHGALIQMGQRLQTLETQLLQLKGA